MNDLELEIFWESARYTSVGGKDSYSVRVGSKLLRDSDTQRLFEKWLKARTNTNGGKQ